MDGTTGKNANGDANVASLFKPALRNYFNQQPAYVLREDGSRAKQWRRNWRKALK